MLFFMGSCFVLTFYVVFVTGFSFVVLVVSFSQKSKCMVWLCLSTFW